MKAFSRYLHMEFRQKSQSDLIARVLIGSRRFVAFSVDCGSNGLFARQIVPPIFSLLACWCSCLNGCRWVETFLCSVGYSDDLELMCSPVAGPEFLASSRLCLEVPICFTFPELTLLTSLSIGCFSFILFVTGVTPNPPRETACDIRLRLPRKEPAVSIAGERSLDTCGPNLA